ncbi:MAG: hypothetical protein U0165_09660 [Polyangiaceae bacterium]
MADAVLANTGYDLYGLSRFEPTVMLNANQVLVEQRWFSPSRPDPADWSFLRIWQAASDHHKIVELLKPFYTQKWLSTGESKGGMTSVYHRRFYPDDVFATVAYVAPQSYGNADPRYINFLNQVGSAECRDALKQLQIEVLNRRSPR